jgi:hypothetical protein
MRRRKFSENLIVSNGKSAQDLEGQESEPPRGDAIADTYGTTQGSDGSTYRTDTYGTTRDNEGNAWRTDTYGTMRGSNGTSCRTDPYETIRCR